VTFPFIRPRNIHPSSAGGGGADNTPNTVNWENITWDGTSLVGTIQSKQITGITSGIYLQIQPGTGSDPDLYYQISASQVTGSQTNQPPSSPWTLVSSNTNVIVSGNQWLSFTCHDTAGFGNRTATVINQSDGNATLDTFAYEIVFF
jgi:hypothetical protein